jgi:hypothetical protein
MSFINAPSYHVVLNATESGSRGGEPPPGLLKTLPIIAGLNWHITHEPSGRRAVGRARIFFFLLLMTFQRL